MTVQSIPNKTKQPKKKRSVNQIRLINDLLLLVGMVLVLAPQATGIPLHEWASFLVMCPLLVHLILDWKWIVSTTKRFFQRQPGEVKFNYVLNWLLFMVMVLVMLSGVVISEATLPAIGVHLIIDPFWSTLHDISGNLIMLILGIHIAMHWRWLLNAINRYILRRA